MTERKLRAKRVRTKLKAKARKSEKPRLTVFVSNNHIYAQVIDDKKGTTIVAVSDKDVEKGKKIEIAEKVGELLGKKAKEAKVKEVVFDRGGKRYHGRIKALADGARKELSF